MLRVVDRIINKINHKFEFIDLGGGMGISYTYKDKKLNYTKYNEIIKKFLDIIQPNIPLIFHLIK